MSMQSNAGASGAAGDILKYIEGGGLENKLGRTLEETDKQTVDLIVKYIKALKESADSGWY
jgi:hypothetical protein